MSDTAPHLHPDAAAHISYDNGWNAGYNAGYEQGYEEGYRKATDKANEAIYGAPETPEVCESCQ